MRTSRSTRSAIHTSPTSGTVRSSVPCGRTVAGPTRSWTPPNPPASSLGFDSTPSGSHTSPTTYSRTGRSCTRPRGPRAGRSALSTRRATTVTTLASRWTRRTEPSSHTTNARPDSSGMPFRWGTVGCARRSTPAMLSVGIQGSRSMRSVYLISRTILGATRASVMLRGKSRFKYARSGLPLRLRHLPSSGANSSHWVTTRARPSASRSVPSAVLHGHTCPRAT